VKLVFCFFLAGEVGKSRYDELLQMFIGMRIQTTEHNAHFHLQYPYMCPQTQLGWWCTHDTLGELLTGSRTWSDLIPSVSTKYYL